MWICKEGRDDWSPCRGGDDPGHEGDGYCHKGYHGPRCELCNGTSEYSHYFDTVDALCKDCHDELVAQTTVLLVIAAVVLGTAMCSVAVVRWASDSILLEIVMRKVDLMSTFWARAGMQFNLKTMIGFLQCLTAVPSVFDVRAPAGSERWSWWIDVLEFNSDIGLRAIIRPECLGTYRRCPPSPLTHTYNTACARARPVSCAVLTAKTATRVHICVCDHCVHCNCRRRLLFGSQGPIVICAIAAVGFISWEHLKVRLQAGA
eukprot:4466984-Prymnesium_polylepis.1